MIRFDITLSNYLCYDGRQLRFEGRRNDELDFRSDRDGKRLVLTDLELAQSIAEGRAKLMRSDPRSNGPASATACRTDDFALRPTIEKAGAYRRLAYVQGAHSDGLVGKIGDSDLNRSAASTALEIGDPTPPAARTLRNWLRKAGERPSASRLLSNHGAKGNRTPRLPPEVNEIIEAEIDKHFLRRPPISLVTLHHCVRASLEQKNLDRAVKLDIPHYDSIRRAVLARPPRDVHEARYGKASADRKFALVRLAPKAQAPLDEIEIDHTLGDLMVVCAYNALPIGRPTVALALDRCTRMPAGIYLGYDPPSVHTVLQLLRNVMLPKLYLDQKVARGEWAVKHSWPVCGVPRKLILDRAMENLSTDLDEIGADIGFDVTFAPRKRPQFKGAIENMLGKLNRRLLHEQRGTTFSNVLERDDYDPLKNAVITHDELLQILHRWLLDVYACGPHRGIRDVPARCWAEMVERYPVEPVEAVEQIEATLGRPRTATLSAKGIVFEHIRYGSDNLVALLADPKFRERAPDRRVCFRYDAGDLGAVRVRDPATGSYFEVPALDQDYARGLSIWQHRVIVKYKNRRTAEAVDFSGIAQAKVEIAAMFETAWRGRRLKLRARAARHDGIGRHAPAGTNEATSPEGSVDAIRRAGDSTIKSAKPETVLITPTKTIGFKRLQQISPKAEEIDDEEDIYAKLGIER